KDDSLAGLAVAFQSDHDFWKRKAGPASLPDEVEGCAVVEATGPPGVLCTAQFAKDQTDKSLDALAPIVVEGVLRVIREPAGGDFVAVVELQVREARRGR